MKRRSGGADAAAGEVAVLADASSHPDTNTSTPTNNRTLKRSCGRGADSFLPPGALPPQAVHTWACNTLGFTPAEACAAASAYPALALLLHASAELDQALQPHWHTVPASSLRGYVSLTRCDRAALWDKFEPAAAALLSSSSSSSSSFSAAASSEAAHLLVRLLLLEPRSLGGKEVRPLACLTKFTLELPIWMAGWAARWGLGSGREVSVLLVTAYGSSSSSACSPPPAPAWRVAVPLLPHLVPNGGGA